MNQPPTPNCKNQPKTTNREALNAKARAPQGDGSILIKRLCDAKAIRYLGRAWALKMECLAAMQTGSRSLSSIAREYHVSKQAVGRLAKKARAIYGSTTVVALTSTKG